MPSGLSHIYVLGIAIKGVDLRSRIICPKDEDFKTKSDEYASYLINCGHNKEHVLEKFNEVSNLSQDEARTRRIKSVENHCVFSIIYKLIRPYSFVFSRFLTPP